MFDRIRSEPALVGGALTAILNALVLLEILALSVEQITGLNVAVAAVLALVVRSQVTPTHQPAGEQGDANVTLLLLVGCFAGIVLLLFGVRV